MQSNQLVEEPKKTSLDPIDSSLHTVLNDLVMFIPIKGWQVSLYLFRSTATLSYSLLSRRGMWQETCRLLSKVEKLIIINNSEKSKREELLT